VIEQLKKRLVSRKLWGFAVATWFLYIGKLSQENWLIFGLVYIGIDVAEKLGMLKMGK